MAQPKAKNDPQTEDSSLYPFTFGCEFEFLVAYLPSDAEDPHVSQPDLPPLLRIDDEPDGSAQKNKVLESLRKTLRAHGIPVKEVLPSTSTESGSVASQSGPPPPGTSSPAASENGDADGEDESLPRKLQGVKVWDVTEDVSVKEKGREETGYEWQCVELRSPAF